ncbi:MAG: AAA family ATPase [Devosia indica]
MANQDSDWLVGFDEDDLDGPASERKRRASMRRSSHDVQVTLAAALLESVVGERGIDVIRNQDSFCLVIEAPGADWVFALQRMLTRFSDWDHHQAKSQARRSSLTDEAAINAQAIAAMSSGGRVFGVSQSPKAMLSSALVSAADMHVVLPQPSNAVISTVIRTVTGKIVKAMPDGIAAGLGFEEIVSCIRQGSTPAQCVDRLVRAAKRKCSTETIGDDVPLVEDLHGYGEEIRTWALNLVDDLKEWRQGKIAMADIDRNIVMYSSPGLGKTTFVKSLAKSAGLPLIATSVAQWFLNSSGNLDGVIKQCDQVFDAAKAVAPAILFLDELDGLPNRATLDSRNSDWWAPVIGHVLTLLDGATSSPASQLIVIGATNHAEKLDAALIRPGRLNRAIEIPMPDEMALAGILRQHLAGDLVGADLTEAARLAVGSSGAQIAAWVKAARRKARSEGRAMVMTDLLFVIAPPDHRSKELLRRISIHEAGHAVVTHTLGTSGVSALSIIASGNRGGYVSFDSEVTYATREALEHAAMQHLAGRAAEEVIFGDPGTGAGGNPGSDLATATRIVALIHLGLGLGETMIYQGDAEETAIILARSPSAAAIVEAHLRQLYSRTLDLIRANATMVETVAAELVERRYINGERFLEIIEGRSKAMPAKEIENG